jgi:hypothetical protein
VRSFWVDEFAAYTDRYTQDATPAIQNKVGQFTSNPLIRNIVGQPKSSFDLRKLMDEKKILNINLSQGRVGEVNATLLGSMLVTKIYLAAMSRADVPAETLRELPNFYFYVDEFQSFSNQSFADILSEARKYKLNLIIAHQYVEQMEEEVRDAVFGNVGTTIAFRVGPFDAETLETIFSPQFTATDLVNLGFAQIYLTLMINGIGSPPFSATTLAPFDPPPSKFVDQVVENSRRVNGRPRAEVENAIRKWHEEDPMVPMEKPKRDYAPKRAEHRSEPKPAAPKQATVAPAVAHPPSPPRPQPPREERPSAEHIDRQERHEKREEPQNNPPLEGAKSLREALAKVTGKPYTPPPVHAHDLKATLQSVAPKAEAPKPAHKPAELPEDVLRSMLAVDETDIKE